jgi:hypothetical protein
MVLQLTDGGHDDGGGAVHPRRLPVSGLSIL